jgi:demethylmenaquinone methyltransferase/2-methoxy-6-polyprenyl-1,4-benzoquinol methylase
VTSSSSEPSVPAIVADAYRRAAAAGFAISSELGVGRLLAVLAAAVPHGGRILEIGTGVGAGTAWIVHGLGQRTDVEVVTVDKSAETARVAMQAAWPGFVRMVVADVLTILEGLGTFDLVFADAEGGKWTGLDRTIAAVSPGGHLLVDDMEPAAWTVPQQEAKTRAVREALLRCSDLITVELHSASGIILSTRLRDAGTVSAPAARRSQ